MKNIIFTELFRHHDKALSLFPNHSTAKHQHYVYTKREKLSIVFCLLARVHDRNKSEKTNSNSKEADFPNTPKADSEHHKSRS